MMTDAELNQIADRIAAQLLAAEVLTVAETAALLRISRNTVTRMARDGRLPGYRFGDSWRFRRSALLEIITPASTQGSRPS